MWGEGDRVAAGGAGGVCGAGQRRNAAREKIGALAGEIIGSVIGHWFDGPARTVESVMLDGAGHVFAGNLLVHNGDTSTVTQTIAGSMAGTVNAMVGMLVARRRRGERRGAGEARC